MSENTDTKLDPAAQHAAAAEPRLAKTETELVTHPLHEGDTDKKTDEVTTKDADTSGHEGKDAAKDVKDEATEKTTSVAGTISDIATSTKDSVFSMFGGGTKAKKKEQEPEDELEEESGSSKKKAQQTEEDEVEQSPDIHFEPVHKLTEKVEIQSNEELEKQTFKMRAKLFRLDKETREWKERGTGDVRLLKHTENGKTRLVMRRDKTLKVCANHYVVPDMKLSPNIGSERSWVWNVVADVSEGEPEAQILAIRFANAENANLFKEAFTKAQQENEGLVETSTNAQEEVTQPS